MNLNLSNFFCERRMEERAKMKEEEGSRGKETVFFLQNKLPRWMKIQTEI